MTNEISPPNSFRTEICKLKIKEEEKALEESKHSSVGVLFCGVLLLLGFIGFLGGFLYITGQTPTSDDKDLAILVLFIVGVLLGLIVFDTAYWAIKHDRHKDKLEHYQEVLKVMEAQFK